MTVNTATPDYIVDGVLTDGEAWVALGTATPSSANVTFTSSTGANDWSQYMDLKIIGYVRSTHSNISTSLLMNFNNDGGSNYSMQYLYNSGTSTASATATTTYAYGGWIVGAGAGANEFSTVVIDIFDINSGKFKSSTALSADGRDTANYTLLCSQTWKSQAAITEIDLTGVGVTLAAGTRLDLFGILPRMVTA
tara:strand:- start:1596 stop:2177 length:582 start_codon:yes stop_codon:yes gene_type:complete